MRLWTNGEKGFPGYLAVRIFPAWWSRGAALLPVRNQNLLLLQGREENQQPQNTVFIQGAQRK